MLSRAADNLYWLARYIERAENMARLIDVALRMSSTALGNGADDNSEWHSAIVASGCEQSFYARHEVADADSVIAHLVADPDNPSSILSCLATARQSSRAVRTGITTEMWETVNSSWLTARAFGADDFSVERVRKLLDWVKERSLLFSSAAVNTMLRNDAYWFSRLGTFLERADNTARILDVKYNVLLPDYESVGGTLDYYQWTALLRAVSAVRAYHWVYRDRVKPWLVAELLILRPEMPRSLAACMREITQHLDLLGDTYGARGECHRLAGKIHSKLLYGRVESIFQDGLHEFLTNFIDQTTVLGDRIARQYLI